MLTSPISGADERTLKRRSNTLGCPEVSEKNHVKDGNEKS